MTDIAPRLERPVVLLGLSGTGKSTLAPLVAARLGVPAQDTDALVEARAGKRIPEIFGREGEPAFRSLERQVFLEVLGSGSGVVATGGGTVCDASAWTAMRAAGAVSVRLHAKTERLAKRVRASDRPLLAAGDPAAKLRELEERRRPWYRRADLEVDTGEGSPESLADGIAEAVLAFSAETVPVRLGARSHLVRIGLGDLSDLGACVDRRLPPLGAAAILGLVSDDTVDRLYSDAVAADLERQGYRVVRFAFPAGEASKTFATLGRILDALVEGGLQRGSPVVALGGGVVGDLAGLAAALLHRGDPVVQVPTTLLAMVDSAIGGKTAVDHPAGKNLIGAFHQPAAVEIRMGVLATLDEREYVAGLGEVVKYALLDPGHGLLDRLETDALAIRRRDPEALAPIVRHCVAYKARIVEADETEAGLRRLLNLGHTLGHALEAHTGYERWRHGEAVALGLVAAVKIAVALGEADAKLLDRLTALLAVLGLPHDTAPLMEPGVIERATNDKKMQGHEIEFVVPVSEGGAKVRRLTIPELGAVLIGEGDGR